MAFARACYGLLFGVELQSFAMNHSMQGGDDVRGQFSGNIGLAGTGDVVDQTCVGEASFVKVGDQEPFVFPEHQVGE